MEIRKIEPRDFAIVAQLENENWLQSSTPVIIDSTAEKIIDKLSKGVRYYLAVENGEILAVLDFQEKYPFPSGAQTLLFGLMVKKEERHKGIGQALIHFLIELAQKENYKKISMAALGSNPQALHFYEKLGFILEGKQSKEFFINEQWVDNYWYAYFL